MREGEEEEGGVVRREGRSVDVVHRFSCLVLRVIRLVHFVS